MPSFASLVSAKRIAASLLLAAAVISIPTATALDNGLVTKPPMGWNSWNKFACSGINETMIRQTADALVSSGLLAAGYDTLTLDDCWSAVNRDSNGNLTHHATKFPSGMKAIGDYIHARGLKYGIYASIGNMTCTGDTAGSINNEFRDTRTFASWGVDYIKADRCGTDRDTLNMAEVYGRWRDGIAASGRPMILSASDNGGVQEPWSWGPITAHQWRTTGDIRDTWDRMLSMFDGNARHPAATAPGSYNDPDMLEVGNGGMTDTEYRTHMGLWALASAPLIAGNDVRSMSAATKAILTHNEVLDINQDALSFQAIKVSDNGAGLQVWYKPVSGAGVRAVGLLNRGASAATMTINWSAIGLATGSASVRDVWARTNRGTFTNSYSVSVPSHGMALLRIVGTDRVLTTGYVSDQTWSYMANEWGPAEKNRSNGEQGGADGRTLMLGGVSYTKGLGTHAPSAIEFRTNAGCSTFSADIGIDDEVGSAGSAIFQVWGDGVKLYDSGVMRGTTATKSINVNISGRRSLRLQVVAVETANSDHADWANARVTCGGPTPTPTTTPTPTPGTIANGFYRIMARHSGSAVVVQSASTTDGANVFQWTYGGTATNDEWQVTGLGGGYYTIVARHSGKAMTVQSASTADGANIFQWPYGGANTNDEWSFVDAGGGYYRIVNRHSGKVAEVAGGVTTNGTNVQQWTWNGGTHQQFQLISVP